jgi:hypothetical protein
MQMESELVWVVVEGGIRGKQDMVEVRELGGWPAEGDSACVKAADANAGCEVRGWVG